MEGGAVEETGSSGVSQSEWVKIVAAGAAAANPATYKFADRPEPLSELVEVLGRAETGVELLEGAVAHLPLALARVLPVDYSDPTEAPGPVAEKADTCYRTANARQVEALVLRLDTCVATITEILQAVHV